ncbi:MAG: DegT/DnrJ/EryC1/StrS family aminotransferase, partial [Ktedonobacterales bacterium]
MKQEIKLVDLQRQYQEIREEVIEAIGSALDGMDLFLGPNVRQFEREFADYYGVSEGVGVASGTDAIHLALRACDIGPGDEVITVAHTFIAKVEAIAMTGARPIFVDVDAQTATMDPEQVTAAITPRTRALLPVHLYGQAADMNPLRGIAREYGLWIIEDA